MAQRVCLQQKNGNCTLWSDDPKVQKYLGGSSSTITDEDLGKVTPRAGFLTDGSFWTGSMGFLGNLIDGFNYKKQENDRATAEANRDAALAFAQAGGGAPQKNNTVLYVGIAVVVVLVVVLFVKKK